MKPRRFLELAVPSVLLLMFVALASFARSPLELGGAVVGASASVGVMLNLASQP